MKFSPYEKGGGRNFGSTILSFCSPPPQSIINDQSLMMHFEGLGLLSPSEITQELCKLMVKLNETIEVSPLWSI